MHFVSMTLVTGEMNMKKLIAVILTGMFLVSSGAFAADKHTCKKGKHYDEAKKHCVKDA